MDSPAMHRKKKTDLGAGLRISKQNIENHPAGPPRHSELSQAERAFTLASTFLSGVLAISASQFIGAPLKLIDPVFYEGYMAYTKESFAVLVTCLTQWWAPTVVRVSGDSSMLGQLIKKKDGSLQCNFSDRMVMMANHQLYTDWLYLWWIAYTNNMHGFIYIILKESLKNIPIIGWGCQFYNFIFLARNWEEDQNRFRRHLAQLNKPNDPMWLIIFPEGTNLSATTREKSKKWAQKNGLQDMKHQLLPRSTGLRFCLNELKDTTEWLYDCTIAYEGVPQGQFGQDIFTLRSSFFEGRPPKSVNMHWRRFRVSEIPIGNTKAFEVWLRNRWREKDYMLEYFNRNTRFPADDFWKEHLDMDARSSSSGEKTLRTVPKPAVQIETEVKSGSWNEFVKIFAPITSVMMALSVAYGASPNELPLPGGKQFFEQNLQALLSGGLGDMPKSLPSPDELEKMIEGAARLATQQEAKPKDAQKVQQLTQENLAKLVKETAIKNGMVLPGGMRRVNTALPALSAAPTRAKSAAPTKTTPRPSQAKAKPTAPKSKPALKPPNSQPKPTTKPSATPKAPVPTKEMLTTSGIRIKVPITQLEAAKQATTSITTKNGIVLRLGKKEIEDAQKKGKAGETVWTASGVPIRVGGGGEQGKGPVAKKAPVKNPAAPSVSKPAAKPAAKSTPAKQAAKGTPTPTPTTKAKTQGPQVVTRKNFQGVGSVAGKK